MSDKPVVSDAVVESAVQAWISNVYDYERRQQLAEKMRYTLEQFLANQAAQPAALTQAEIDKIIKSVDCGNGGDNWDGDGWDSALVQKAFAAGLRAAAIVQPVSQPEPTADKGAKP